MASDQSGRRRLMLFACASGTIVILAFLLFAFGRSSPLATTTTRQSAPFHYQDHQADSDSSFEPPRPSSNLLDDVSNSTLGFERIFVINLPDRTDRRDAFSLAAAFSGLRVEYVDGVRYTEEDMEAIRKILPPTGSEKEPNPHPAAVGSWRAHMNAVRKVVELNLTSALILEDDIDWDLRLKSQLRQFAVASRMLTQPLAGTKEDYLDPSFPAPSWGQSPRDFPWEEGLTSEPSISPYGDHWDILWLGHCGNELPTDTRQKVPLGRVIMSDDPTVPELQYVDSGLGVKEILDYPDHTRIVARSWNNVCITGYAISQAGARRLLYELTVHKRDGGADMMFGAVCNGVKQRDLATCVSVQPSIFHHHRPVGYMSKFSDISGWADEMNEVATSQGIRLSTRLNFPQLVAGNTSYVDSYPDGA